MWFTGRITIWRRWVALRTSLRSCLEGQEVRSEESRCLAFFSHRQVVDLAEPAVLAAMEAAGGAVVVPKAEPKAG